MTREDRFGKAHRDGRGSASRTTPVRPAAGVRAPNGSDRGRGSRKKKTAKKLEIGVSADDSKRSGLPVANPELYRPLKRPITLRLDADVLAWFKKGGRRYQTRINTALRELMEREIRNSRR